VNWYGHRRQRFLTSTMDSSLLRIRMAASEKADDVAPMVTRD
jgi:hypothetical protein